MICHPAKYRPATDPKTSQRQSHSRWPIDCTVYILTTFTPSTLIYIHRLATSSHTTTSSSTNKATPHPHSTMSLRLASLRRLARPPASLSPLRYYATPTQPPRPSRNSPTPAGLEGLFGTTKPAGQTVAPKPAGSEPPSGPSTPKTPDVQLGDQPKPPSQSEQPIEDDGEVRRHKLSDTMRGSAGKKSGTGGGGGSGPGGAGGPGGLGGMTPNQLLLAVVG